MIRLLALLMTVALTVAAPATAQDTRRETVRFDAGTSGTTIRDSITGYGSVLYSLSAQAGQTMRVRLSSDNRSTYFNIYAPGRGPGDEALAAGTLTGSGMIDLNQYRATLPATGEYTISVYMVRAAARRGERSNFSLEIGVDGATGGRVEGDFADGMAGGPDFFQVATRRGGPLNLRRRPSAGAAVVARLADGTNVRNLGCRAAEGRRWCRVATLADPGDEGWAAGTYLIEGSDRPSRPSVGGEPPATRDVRVRFDAGSTGTELRGTLSPGQSRRYVIGARDGQFLYTRVAPRGGAVSYQIFNPDGSVLLDQITSDREYRGQLYQSGDHVIEVINRNNRTADYNIIIGIE